MKERELIKTFSATGFFFILFFWYLQPAFIFHSEEEDPAERGEGNFLEFPDPSEHKSFDRCK